MKGKRKYTAAVSAIAISSLLLLGSCAPRYTAKAPETTQAVESLYRITSSDATEYWPRVSFDGKYLAYLYIPASRPESDQEIHISELSYSTDGVNARNTIVLPYKGVRSPSWRPGTNEIVFILGRQIVMVNPFRPRGIRILYSSAVPVEQPSFSPDGNILAFDTFINNRWWIMTLDLKTGVLTTVVPGTSPQWSRDGTKLTFDDTRDGKSMIYVWDLKSHTKYQMTKGPKDAFPTFASGSDIIYESLRKGHWQLLFLSSKQGEVQLTRGDTNSYTPTWSPQNYVFFTSNVGASNGYGVEGLNDIWALKLANE